MLLLPVLSLVLLVLLLPLESATAARIPSLSSEAAIKWQSALDKQLLLTKERGKTPKTVFLNTTIQLESFLLAGMCSADFPSRVFHPVKLAMSAARSAGLPVKRSWSEGLVVIGW